MRLWIRKCTLIDKGVFWYKYSRDQDEDGDDDDDEDADQAELDAMLIEYALGLPGMAYRP